jgi:hypothetical protein
MPHPAKFQYIARYGLAATLAFFTHAAVMAAGQTIRLADDSNSRLEIKDAVVDGDRTTVLFWTWPDRGDPNFRNECGRNYYTVTLSPGLPAAKPKLLAEGACAGFSLLQGGLLRDGSGKFIVQDRLEHWRAGERVSSKPLAALEHVGVLGLNSSEVGSQLIDFNSSGGWVMAVAVSGHAGSNGSGVSTVVAGVDSNDDKRWLITLEQPTSPPMPKSIWAGEDGSALLHYEAMDRTQPASDVETRLLHVSAAGERNDLTLVNIVAPYDFNSMQPGSEEDLQKAFEHMRENRSEQIKSLRARAGTDGGFDVLFKRESDQPDRNGYSVLRLGRDGGIRYEQSLGTVIDDHGLDRWFDFYVDGSELILLSSALVTQTGVNSRRKQWPQTVVSRIGLESGEVRSRLIPLDRQYLEAAMNAGDEGQQYLEGQPGGTPVLLASLDGVPLSLSQGWVKKRGTLRIYEATDDLIAFTEHWDEQQAKLAKRAAREDRKARREAGQRQMKEDMAAASGMSSEDFEALSKEEQMMQMAQSGNMEAVMAAAMKQAQAAQAGMTPEQAAQMQAQMAQVQQMMQGTGMGMPARPAALPASQPVKSPSSSFTIDSLDRGHVRFDGKGMAVTLELVDRASGAELMKKAFPDGMVDEYISLGRYKLPANRIGAIIKGPSGEVLADLSPENP